MSLALHDKVVIRPGIVITESLQKEIDSIAVNYALGKDDDMDNYALNIERHALSVGLSYGQFFTELQKALFALRGRVQIDMNSVTTLIMTS